MLLTGLLGLVAACDAADSAVRPRDDAPQFNAAAGVAGAVFTMTNAAANNEVLAFPRFHDGTVGPPTPYATGGDGNGGGLGSQGAVVLNHNRRILLAVNAGSNDVSAFAVLPGPRLERTDRAPAGGTMPVSVTVHDNLVYVLNAGSPNNVSGFRLDTRGRLTPIAGSSRALSAAMTAPAQVEFTPDGRTLVVTEKATNLITVYPVDRKTGLLGTPSFIPSEGQTPFGFAFDRRGRLFVSEAFGGAPGASTLSSYTSGSFAVISSQVGSGEAAACWVVLTPHYAFVTNTASGSVSSYALANDGSVSLAHAVAAFTGDGSGPIDMALSINNRFLYVLATGNGTLRPYAINGNGTLTGLGPLPGLPPTAFGLAAF